MHDEDTPLWCRDTFAMLTRLNVSIDGLDTESPSLQWKDTDGVTKNLRSKDLRGRLQMELNEEYRADWARMKLEGSNVKAYEGIELAPSSANGTHIRYPGLFSKQARFDAMLAWSNNIPCAYNASRLAGTLGSSLPGSCVLCGDPLENPFHVLNHCEKRLHLYRLRHDAAQNALVREIKKLLPEASVSVDIRADRSVDDTERRPDIVVTGLSGKLKSFILDVKIPFPSAPNAGGTFVTRTDGPNIAKYADLATAHAAKHGSCFLGTVMIPSAGPIPKHSFLVLKEVGFSEQKATKALREMDIARSRALPKFTRAPASRPA